MKDAIAYSPETSALVLAITALQCAHGVPAHQALDRAYDVWKEHGGGSWGWAELATLVDGMANAPQA